MVLTLNVFSWQNWCFPPQWFCFLTRRPSKLFYIQNNFLPGNLLFSAGTVFVTFCLSPRLVYLSIRLSVCLSVNLNNLSIRLFVSLFVCLSVCLSVRLLSVRLLSVCFSVCPFVCLSVCLFVYL